jgi:hypothetical protein
VIRIPDHHRELMDERRGCNYLVERILRIWYPQALPLEAVQLDGPGAQIKGEYGFKLALP